MKKTLSVIIRVLLCFVAEFLLFWFKLPPINLKSKDFWGFIIESVIICTVIIAISSITSFIKKNMGKQGRDVLVDGKEVLKGSKKPVKIVLIALAAMVVFTVVMDVVGAKIFNAKSYSNLITLEEGDFSKDVAELKMSQIPVVDRDTATRLAQRELGNITDLVSQFEIDGEYTQINYKNHPYRVTPLKYAGFIKWLTNSSEGVPGYITIDLTTQEAELVRLKQEIRYSQSEYLIRNVNRYLRFNHPTKIFAEISFEIDENGVPYWVASVIDFKVGFWSGRDICGVVLLNAQTGENKYYEAGEIPTWVDQAYDSDMIIEQLTYNGLYQGGFFNSIFGQKNCTQPTDGYNYIAIDDDVWVYTGITSITEDASNLGFVLSNLRTKETKYYTQAGAEEYSAMESAEGQVQHLGYQSTFPILLNIADRPTYFVSLKDDAGLVKMYAYVDMERYQIVGIGATLDKARAAYLEVLEGENIELDKETTEETKTVHAGIVSAISSAVI
ncbi:MAG: CvpA family protein, partial [Oscillospiraceae bacterium]|nr:CvpA family protein [Oscillospiraceae bacterium]